MPFWKKNREEDGTTDRVEPVERKGLGKVGTIFASGSAMFSDGYANAAIGPAGQIIKGYLYPDYFVGDKTINASLLSSMAFAGIVIGQLGFGYVSDKTGRKLGMLICTAIVFVFSILSACSAGSNPQVLINCLIAFRFFLGIGIGGEYPCGSVAAAEGTEDPAIRKGTQQRLFVFATNTMLDFAFPIAYFVALVLLWIFGMDHLRAVWRGTLLLGAIPPLALMYFRLFMKDPEVYRKNNARKARIPYWLIVKRYWVKLLAVSITWFIYDWITYPFGIYSSSITDVANPNGTLYTNIGWGCLINAFYVPGTLIGAYVSDWIGPKYAMITGLLLQAIFGFALSGAYNQLVPNHIAGFAILYGIFISFGELGPGNNLGLLASKAIGPTLVRGQVGAFIGTYTFPYIIEDMPTLTLQTTGVFWIGSALAVVSAAITFFFIPNIKPDQMVDEDVAFREYLAANGYDISQLGEHDTDSVMTSGEVEAGAHEKLDEVVIDTARERCQKALAHGGAPSLSAYDSSTAPEGAPHPADSRALDPRLTLHVPARPQLDITYPFGPMLSALHVDVDMMDPGLRRRTQARSSAPPLLPLNIERLSRGALCSPTRQSAPSLSAFLSTAPSSPSLAFASSHSSVRRRPAATHCTRAARTVTMSEILEGGLEGVFEPLHVQRRLNELGLEQQLSTFGMSDRHKPCYRYSPSRPVSHSRADDLCPGQDVTPPKGTDGPAISMVVADFQRKVSINSRRKVRFKIPDSARPRWYALPNQAKTLDGKAWFEQDDGR
ncbi:glycerophosphoinositol permease [Cryptotrichosporon argae]